MDLLSNTWLFQYLTETFDQRMLASLAKPEGRGSSIRTSINLNVSTLLSDGFLAFDDKLATARRGTIVIELKATDIFADLEAYHFARRFVQGRDYMICIDGMTHRTINLVDRAMLGADFIKADFTGDLFEGGDAARDRLSAIVERNGVDHVILARVETPQALMFGQVAGLQYFQGHHIEKLLIEQQNIDRSRLLRSYQNRTGH